MEHEEELCAYYESIIAKDFQAGWKVIYPDGFSEEGQTNRGGQTNDPCCQGNKQITRGNCGQRSEPWRGVHSENEH